MDESGLDEEQEQGHEDKRTSGEKGSRPPTDRRNREGETYEENFMSL